MTRRTFFLIPLLSYGTYAIAKNGTTELKTIQSVLEHMFPDTKSYNGAKTFGAYQYLLLNSTNKYFDKRDLRFLKTGAKELLKLDKNFSEVSTNRKEKLLRQFEKRKIGKNWLSLLLYYGFEAMLCDPVYGGNINMSGWKNIKHNPPIPMARFKYARL